MNKMMEIDGNVVVSINWGDIKGEFNITQDMYEAVKDDIAKCIEGYKKNNVANEEDL